MNSLPLSESNPRRGKGKRCRILWIAPPTRSWPLPHTGRHSVTSMCSYIFRLTFYNEETRVLCYDKRQLAYICANDKAVAGHVDWGATFSDFSYRDEEKVTRRWNVVPHSSPPHYFLPPEMIYSGFSSPGRLRSLATRSLEKAPTVMASSPRAVSSR